MRRLTAFLLALCLILSLTACVSRTERIKEQESPPAPAEPVKEPEPPATPKAEPEPVEEPEPEAEEPPSFLPSMIADYDALIGLDTQAVPWGWGPFVDDDNRSVGCQQLQEKYGAYNAFFIGPNEPDFYLTFDEGYENGYTGAILDVLKEKECPAVFFCTLPYIKQNPDLVRRMIDEGHIVGSHSASHPNFTTISLEDCYEEIRAVHDYVKENYDYTMSTFRFPEGAFSEQVLALVGQMGYRTVFWSFAYNDWDPNNQMEPGVALQKAVDAIHPGAIYLFHAVSKTNTEILGEFIDTVRDQGLTFRPFYLSMDS